MTLANTVARVTGRHGAAYTILRRTQAANAQPWKAGTETVSFDYVQARERGFKPVEIRGGIQEGDVLIVVDASSGCGCPKTGDRIALGNHYSEDTGDWRQIISINAARVAGDVNVYRLQARA